MNGDALADRIIVHNSSDGLLEWSVDWTASASVWGDGIIDQVIKQSVLFTSLGSLSCGDMNADGKVDLLAGVSDCSGTMVSVLYSPDYTVMKSFDYHGTLATVLAGELGGEVSFSPVIFPTPHQATTSSWGLF
jgi:hypothetical protein